jgi:hypothetical protein
MARQKVFDSQPLLELCANETTQLQLVTLLATSLLSTLAAAVDFITIDGGNFINNVTNKRFEIIGVAYAAPPPAFPPKPSYF